MAGRVHAPQLEEEKKLKREQSLTTQRIESFIFAIRGQRIIIDRDLAQIYGVKTSRLNEQVKRNKERFPEDFVFQLTREETETWIRSRSQIMLTSQQGGVRKMSSR
ncbi:MAG: ORF6N domain-containing protein [Deltaproteobacteria bacterium]|nr:ORF6N domain-containing protein [Deltaproteobacteria bacterium]